MCVKLLSELVLLSKNIKYQCKTLFEDPYVEGATPKDNGILVTIRDQLSESRYISGKALFEMCPFVLHQFGEVLEITDQIHPTLISTNQLASQIINPTQTLF